MYGVSRMQALPCIMCLVLCVGGKLLLIVLCGYVWMYQAECRGSCALLWYVLRDWEEWFRWYIRSKQRSVLLCVWFVHMLVF